MYKNLDSIVECYSCGLFLNKNDNSKIRQKCPRCNSKIQSDNAHSIDSLFFAISSLMLFVILSIYPIISLNINNQDLEATILKTVYILFEQEFFLVSFLVLFTIIIAPVFNSIIIILIFLQTGLKIKIFKDSFLFDGFYFFKNWGFIEVFVISLIVTYIKLIGMISNTKFDVGFYIILLYVFCFIMSNLRFEAKTIFGD